MEEKLNVEKNLENKEIKKKKQINPLIIIIVLVALLIIVGVVLVFTRKDARDVYFNIIDKGVESGYEFIDSYFDELNDNKMMSGSMSFEISGNGNLTEEDKELMNIVNDLDINYEIETSNKNKLGNINLDLDYKNDDLISLDMMLNNQDMYINLGSLYEKNIKIAAEEMNITWYNNMEDDFKTLLKEISEVLKDNLSKDYFDKDDGTLIINSKDVKVNRFELKLSGQDIYNLQLNIIDDLKNNNNFIQSLMAIYNYEKDEVLTYLDEYASSVELDNNISLVIEIFLSKKNNELIKFTVGDSSEKISIIKANDNKYDITYTEYNITDVVGFIEVKDELVEINYDDNDMTLVMNIKDDNVNFNMSGDGLEFNFVIEENNDELKYLYEFIFDSSGIELKMTLDGTSKEINNVTNKDVSNYVLLEDMTEDDLMTIYENVYNNNTLMTLIEDVMNIYSSYMYDDSYYEYDDYYYEEDNL